VPLPVLTQWGKLENSHQFCPFRLHRRFGSPDAPSNGWGQSDLYGGTQSSSASSSLPPSGGSIPGEPWIVVGGPCPRAPAGTEHPLFGAAHF
jgi:hypothetical protein